MSNNLLYAITSRGYLRIEQFYEIFNSTCLPDELDDTTNRFASSNSRRRTIRTLDALGHCEFDFDQRKVFVCPPTLALLPSQGLSKVVLCGARTPKLIEQLKKRVKMSKSSACLSVIPQFLERVNLPDCLMIEAVGISTIEEIAQATSINSEIDNPVAWKLLNFSASIEEIIQDLDFRQALHLDWPNRAFDIDSLTFHKGEIDSEQRYRLIAYKNPTDQQNLHLFWDDDSCAQVDRDWGRFVILSKTSRNVLLYDEKHFYLGVPQTVHLPRLLARALTLCSGLAPEIGKEKNVGSTDEKRMLMYRNVSPVIAQAISKKLNQSFIPCLFDRENKEVTIC